MAIEIRRVPANWQHTRDKSGQYIPMFGAFAIQLRRWKAVSDMGVPRPVRGVGKHPPRGSCSPFAPSKATHFQVYEVVSEGTPLSPVFATPQDIVRWLGWFGYSREDARAFVQHGAVPSLSRVGGKYVRGIRGASAWVRRKRTPGPLAAHP